MKLGLVLLTILFMTSAALAENIVCVSPRLRMPIKIGSHSVVFMPEQGGVQSRNIASTIPARSKKQGQGLNKYFSYDGNKYSLHISNTKEFNEVDDYISIRSSRGHEITYPVNCHHVL